MARTLFGRQNLLDDDVVFPTIAEIVEVDETVRNRRRDLIQPYGAVVNEGKGIIRRRLGKNSFANLEEITAILDETLAEFPS